MIRYYILDDKQPVPVDNVLEWAEWFEGDRDRRRVDLDEIGEVTVSTVFLGMNHNWGDGPPILFETLVFGGPLDGEMYRYETWDEAVIGHQEMVERVRAT